MIVSDVVRMAKSEIAHNKRIDKDKANVMNMFLDEIGLQAFATCS